MEDNIVTLPVNINLRPAQTAHITAVINRMNQYKSSAEAKLRELASVVDETILYISKDLGVPPDYKLSSDLAAFQPPSLEADIIPPVKN